MNPIKLKINQPDPPPALISRHKNFNSFIGNYQKYYSPRGIRYLFRYDIKRLVFIIIIVVLLLIMLLTDIEASILKEKFQNPTEGISSIGSSFVKENSK